MDKLELIFIIIEGICIIVEIGLEIYSIIDSRNKEKNIIRKLNDINAENRVLEKMMKGK